jgi:hypothetical protein
MEMENKNRIMSLKKLLFIITFSSITLFSLRFAPDSDTFWHLATGKQIVEQQSIPAEDFFSYTKYGEDWKGAQSGWLMQVLFYKTFQTFGFAGLSLLLSLFVISSYWVLYRLLDGNYFINAFLLIVSATAASVFWAARPFILSILLSAIFIYILEIYQNQHKNRLYFLPLIMILWVNGHGGFIIGFIFIAIYAFSNFIQWIQTKPHYTSFKNWIQSGSSSKFGMLVKYGTLSALASLINPGGISILLYPFQNVGVKSAQIFIEEWQSPNFHQTIYWPFAILLFLIFVSVATSAKKISLLDFLLITFWSGMSLWSARNLPQFSLVSVLIISRYTSIRLISNTHPQDNTNAPQNNVKITNFINILIALLMGFAVIFKVIETTNPQFHTQNIKENYPVDALAFIQHNINKPILLNSYNWGGYIIWAYPQLSVFIDGRADLYKDPMILEWYRLVTAQDGWRETIVEYNIDTILIEPSWPINLILEEAGWQTVFQDKTSVVWQKLSE